MHTYGVKNIFGDMFDMSGKCARTHEAWISLEGGSRFLESTSSFQLVKKKTCSVLHTNTIPKQNKGSLQCLLQGWL